MDRGEMNQLSPDRHEDLLEVLYEVSTLMSAEYAQLRPLPDDHPLAQAGLEMGQKSLWTTSRTAKRVSHSIICST
jgi:hypothetical protein